VGIGGTASNASFMHARCSWRHRAGARNRRNHEGAYRRSSRELLSPRVSIQTERHFTIISTGVSRLIRHPMSLGALLLFLGTPLLLGSLNETAMGFALIVLLALSTLGEDALLVHEVDGDAAYTHKVQYRLMPSVCSAHMIPSPSTTWKVTLLHPTRCMADAARTAYRHRLLTVYGTAFALTNTGDVH